MGNFKLMKDAQGETEEILNDLSQKSPNHSFNIIDDLLLKVHPSMMSFLCKNYRKMILLKDLKCVQKTNFM